MTQPDVVLHSLPHSWYSANAYGCIMAMDAEAGMIRSTPVAGFHVPKLKVLNKCVRRRWILCALSSGKKTNYDKKKITN